MRGPRLVKAAGVVVTTLVMTLAVVLVVAAPASADPAGPTDYESEVTTVDPATPAIDLEIIGGDSFVQLTVTPGTEVLVIGYQGEPYLRFDADGLVHQNERSPSRWLNDDRYGQSEVPVGADPDAEPHWIQVADTGSFAWHDHRTHWMNPARPLGAEPGDVVLEAVVPMVVNGQSIAAHVQSRLLAGPSLWPAVIGAVIAAGVGIGAARVSSAGPLLVGLAVWSLAATGITLWATLTLPGEARPGPGVWVLPLVALVVAAAVLVLASRQRWSLQPPEGGSTGELLIPGLVALAGLELVLWALIRRDAFTRALIPGDAPDGLDRFISAGAGVFGAVATAIAFGALAGVGAGARAQRTGRPH
jgi:hypothetical protein